MVRRCRSSSPTATGTPTSEAGPRTVVVLHVLLSEDLVQNEPGVRCVPDPAVGNDVFVPIEASAAIELLELVIGLEGIIVAALLQGTLTAVGM